MTTLLHSSELARVISGSSSPTLLACSFDGILAPIVPDPGNARIPERTAGLLRDLAATQHVVFAVLSGRSLPDLRQRLDLPCVLAGNHGLEISGEGIDYVHPIAATRANLIDEAQRLVQPCLASYSGAWIENKRVTATIHFRQVPAARRYRLLWDVRQAMRPFGLNLGLRAGKSSLDLHPRVGWDKGQALQHIRETLGLQNSPCVVFGDDATDESMFLAVPRDLTVRVGPATRTNAKRCLPSTAAVPHVLEQALEILTGFSSLARAAG